MYRYYKATFFNENKIEKGDKHYENQNKDFFIRWIRIEIILSRNTAIRRSETVLSNPSGEVISEPNLRNTLFDAVCFRNYKFYFKIAIVDSRGSTSRFL